ncbi:MAG: TetR family transcriptional regulator C-terminal domain-containing protein [Lachnospiraceae bacterium]|nr:TetR family transcriptional regulator C-terminal domain-containing protein [Lachnospiraceae bacterium]
MAIKNNRRTTMTKRLLKTALIELMQETPINKITIKDICQQADLSRSTFYLHYTDQYHLLNDLESEAISTIMGQMKKITPDLDPLIVCREFTSYIHKEQTVFRTLLCQKENLHFQIKLIEEIHKTSMELLAFSSEDSIRLGYKVDFIIHGSLSIFRNWIFHGFDMEEAEISELVFDLCCQALD